MTKDVVYQNKDIACKTLALRFKDKSFGVFGVDIPRIVNILPGDLPVIIANEMRIDSIFLLEDGSIAIIDYESDFKTSNYLKYGNYMLRAMEMCKDKKGRYPNVRMIVIYTCDVMREDVNPDFIREGDRNPHRFGFSF
jgi:hypothetical protein